MPGLVLLRRVAHQVRRQLFTAGQVQRQHHGFAHSRVFQQATFDFPQLDAKASDFDLMVDPAHVFDLPVSALAHPIAGSVEPSAHVRKRVSHKAFGGHARALVIALRQTGAAHVQFARGALRHLCQPGIENVRHAGTDHAADGHAARALLQLLGRQASQRHDHGLCRAIGVEKLLRPERGPNPLHMLTGQGFAARDAQAHRQGLLLRGQPLRQLAAVAWGEPQNVDLLFTDQLADLLRVPLPLSAQHHPCAAQQRHQQPLGRRIEVDGVKMQFTVVRAHAEAIDHRTAMHGDFAVGHHHPFGLAGGTRGVNEVGLMLRQADKRQLGSRVGGQLRAVLLGTPARHALRQWPQGLKQSAVAEQQVDAAVFNHVMQAFERVFRVQRHVSAPGLENGQQADHHLQRALQRQPHPHLRAHAAFTQHPRQTVGAAVQLAVTQVLPGKGQGNGLGPRQRLFGKQRVNTQVRGVIACRGGHGLNLLLSFVGVHQRQVAQALLRITQQPLQQRAPMRGHASDARFIKQVRAVRQAAPQPMVEVGDFQIEVKLGGPRVVGQVLDGHARQLPALLEFPALDVAHHLKQRVVGRAARRLQRFDHVIERQVLMGLPFNHGVAHLFEQRADTHVRVELAAQHLGVEEGADQPFTFGPNAVGHRGADAHVGLATVAIEQHGQGGGHGHEQRQAVLGIETAHAGRQLITQVKAKQLTLMALHRRPWAITRQLQQRVLMP